MSERVNVAVKIRIQLDRNAKKYEKKRSELMTDLLRLKRDMTQEELSDYGRRIV